MSIKACDDLRTDPLIGTYYVPVLFGVELAGQCRGTDEVTEQHSELTAFSVRGLPRGWGCHLRRLVFLSCYLLRRLRGGRNRRRTRFSGPHQHSALVVDRKVVDLNQFLFEGFKRLLIEMKLEREGAVRHAPATLEHGCRLVQDLLKGHRQPSVYATVRGDLWG